jgi:large subunit ribosomal protein L9
MEVILLERVEKLGTDRRRRHRQERLRPQLSCCPNKKALRANEANKKVFEANRAKIEPTTPSGARMPRRHRRASTASRSS